MVQVSLNVTLHYIRNYYDGLSKRNFKEHYGDSATEQLFIYYATKAAQENTNIQTYKNT